MPKAPKIKVSQSKPIHPNSRKAFHLHRDNKHKARVVGRRQQKSLKQDSVLDKYIWFQTNMDATKDCFTRKELTELVLDYMKRFDDEIEQIAIVNSIGFRANSKQYSSRSDSIKFTQDKELNEFSSTGLEVPNLTKKSNVQLFKAWSGEMRFFDNIEKIQINQRDAEKYNLVNVKKSE